LVAVMAEPILRKDAFMTELVERIADPSDDKLLATLIKEAFTMEWVEAIEVPRLTKDAFTSEDSVDRPPVTLTKEAFTIELVEVTEVLSWDRLVSRDAKEAFTVVLVADAAEVSVDKLLVTLTKEAFTMEFVEVTEVFNWVRLDPRL